MQTDALVMQMKLASPWRDTSQPFDHGSSKRLEGRHDVAMDGLTGSSAALAPPRKGTVSKANTIGNAASGRNGGMCNAGLAQTYAAIDGEGAANRRDRAFDPGVDMVERLVEEERIDCASPVPASPPS